MCGHPMSDWPEIWQGTYWSHFKMIHRLCLWKPWSRGASPLRGLFWLPSIKLWSNDVEMTWNLTCSLFLTFLKYLAVFAWFWQDWIFWKQHCYFWQVLRLHVASWCWGGKVTFLVSTNAPSRYSDELLNFCSRCASKRFFWRRACDLTKSLWAIFLLVFCSLFELPGEFYGSDGYHVPSRGKGLRIDIRDVDLGFCFWPCDLTSCIWQVRGSGLVLTVWPSKLYVECWGVDFGFDLVT